MEQTIVQITVTAIVNKSPEEFLSEYETLLIEDIETVLHSRKGVSIKLDVVDYELGDIEEL